jgi:hypothetical protein
VFVTAWANTFVFRNLLGKWRAIYSLVKVSQLSGFRLPNLAVTCGLSGQGVGDLVQNHLLYNVHVSRFDEVP